MDRINSNNTDEHLNDVSPVELYKLEDLLPDEGKNDTPINNEEVYKETLSAIDEINKIYLPDNAELLEVINQRNDLLDEIIVIWKYENGKWCVKEAKGSKVGNLLY